MFKICQNGLDLHYFGSGQYGWCDVDNTSSSKSSLVAFDLMCEAKSYISQSDLTTRSSQAIEFKANRVMHTVQPSV